MATTLTEKMRKAVRISNTSEAITDEINDTIEACKKDMESVGIINIDEKDALIVRAIKLYCRAEFNYSGVGEKYRESYELQKMSLCMDMDYITEKQADTSSDESEV